MVYRTKTGDTWDRIAKEVYGAEGHTTLLMSSNQEKLNYYIFPDGVELQVPDLPEEEDTYPEWRS